MSVSLLSPIIILSTLITTATTPIPVVSIDQEKPDIASIYEQSNEEAQTLIVPSVIETKSFERDSYDVIAPPPPPPVVEEPVVVETTRSSFSVPQSSKAPLSGTAKEQIVQLGQQYLGVPYVFGAASPSGWDCSGYVKWVTQQVTGVNLPHGVGMIARSNSVHEITSAEAQPGDFVVLSKPGNENYHMGIYLGGSRMMHAPQPGDATKVSENFYAGGSQVQFFSLNAS